MRLPSWLRPRPPEPAPPAEPTPPPGVWVIDGHWWENRGREDTTGWPDEHKQWARRVWRCLRCSAESQVFNNSPRVWAVMDLSTGQLVDSAPADSSKHVPVICPGHD